MSAELETGFGVRLHIMFLLKLFRLAQASGSLPLFLILNHLSGFVNLHYVILNPQSGIVSCGATDTAGLEESLCEIHFSVQNRYGNLAGKILVFFSFWMDEQGVNASFHSS